jgi:hypothetical protein
LRGSGKAGAHARRILVEHKHGKDIAEDHPGQDHANSGKR